MKCSCMTKIGMLLNFANFWQRKGSQSETTEHIVTDFWDPIVPKKVPSVICATIAKKTGYYLWHFHVPWIFGTVFWHHIYNSWLFSFGNWNSRAFSNAIPHYKHPWVLVSCKDFRGKSSFFLRLKPAIKVQKSKNMSK